MKNMPKVLLEKWDAEEESRLFMAFLNHPSFPQHRKMIFRAFPELERKINSGQSEKKAVKEFVSGFGEQNGGLIAKVVGRDREIVLKRMPDVLKALSQAMEYEWERKLIYKAIPTILPFSPFGDGLFYFSITGEVLAGKESRVVLISAHEISHFIFFDVLKGVERKLRLKLNPAAVHYLKESLTAALFNEEPIKSSLNIDKYLGNPEIREIYVIYPRKYPESFVNLIRELYRDARKKRRSFSGELIDLIKLVHLSQTIFSKKRELWNKYGDGIVDNLTQFVCYKAPIVLK